MNLKVGSSGEGLPKSSKTSQAAERDDIQRRLGLVLIIRQPDGNIRSPVITLSTEKTSVYTVVEKHLKPEAVVGPDRWWRLCKALYSPALEAWRPRVNGTQLKALQGARLPETEEEWQVVRETLQELDGWLKDDTNPDLFLNDLKELASSVIEWWENRTKREGSSGPSKRVAPGGVSLPNKRQHLGGEHDAPSLAGEVQISHPLLQELAAAAAGGSFPRSHQALRAGIAGPGNGMQLGPGGEAHAGYVEMLTEQAAHAGLMANGLPSHPLGNGPLSDPGGQQALRRLGPRSALTFALGEVRQAEVVPLNVGGRLLQTELSTLMTVPDSNLAALARAWQDSPHQHIFLDRNPQAFEDLLEQLRALRCGEDPPPLPEDPARLAALHRETQFFALPECTEQAAAAYQEARKQREAAEDSRKGQWTYNAIYAETGFQKNPESKLQNTMASINAEVAIAASAGWEVVSVSSGSQHEGDKTRNLHCTFLLRRPRQEQPSEEQ